MTSDPPPSGETRGGERARLEAAIDAFVARHAGRPRQRTPTWTALRAGVVGGSDMASMMVPCRNPFKSYADVVASKAGFGARSVGAACWWGTLFESAIEAVVAVDCGARVAGTDISVPAPAGSCLEGLHANSPDGYAVVTFCNIEGVWQLCFTDAEARAAAAGRPAKAFIALLEFKCPYRRRPKGTVPRHYRPQIWSGLALSPIASYGLFVDAVFRKCALWSLGPGPGYDWTYHRERKNPDWGAPIAWGAAAIYAPRLDARAASGERGLKGAAEFKGAAELDFDEDPAYAAWEMHSRYFGIPLRSPAAARWAGRPFRPSLIDFGDCDADLFDRMLGLFDRGDFRAAHAGPRFRDGRGTADLWGDIAALEAAPPEGFFLLGLIPWKLLEIDYAILPRRRGFLAEVAPRVRACLETAARIRAAPDPAKALAQARAALGPEIPKRRRGTPAQAVSQADIQDLFDAAGGPGT